MTLRPRLAAAAALLAISLVATGASAATTVEITELTGTTVASNLKVDGRVAATFDPTVFTDQTGDAKTPGSDIASATITQVGLRSTDFTVALAGALPTVGSVPGVLHYFWTFTVKGQPQQLHAMNTNYQGLDPGNWYFEAQTCALNPDTNVNECGGEAVPGEYTADGRIVWHLSNADFGATGPTTITDGVVRGTHGAAGVVWLNGAAPESDSLAHGAAQILQPEVTVTTRDAAGTVLGTATPTVTSSGAFTATLPKGTTATATARLGSVQTSRSL